MATAAAGLVATVAATMGTHLAGAAGGLALTAVPVANARSAGFAPPSTLSRELEQVALARGADRLESPEGAVSFYGYEGDVVNSAGQPLMMPTSSSSGEAQKTEPDKNAYLVFDQTTLPGADSTASYGHHFLFQGHEASAVDPATAERMGYITRVNLDADAAHRTTLVATHTTDGHRLPNFDGITWDPWAQRLLLTAELGASGGVWASDLEVPAHVTDVSGALGRGGYEGIQNDSAGNVWIVEDVDGAKKTDASGATTSARKPFLSG